jgi:hypothetical protein
MRGSFEQTYKLPSINFDAFFEALVTKVPYGKVRLFEVKVPDIPTPYGTVKFSLKGVVKAVTCIDNKKDKNCTDEKRMGVAELNGTGAFCIGKGATLSGSDMGYPLSIGLQNNCPTCENGFDGSISLGIKGKAGAFVGGEAGITVQLFPKTDDPWSFDVEIGGEDYIGAELCLELSAKGTYKKTFD